MAVFSGSSYFVPGRDARYHTYAAEIGDCPNPVRHGNCSTCCRARQSLVYVEDLVCAYVSVLTAPDDVVSSQVFNLVAPGEAYRMIDIADRITELVSGCTRSIRQFAFAETGCHVDGSKFKRALPKFAFRRTLPLGIRQLHNAVSGAGITPGDWRSDRYRRTLRLKTLMERGKLTPALCRRNPTAA